MRQAGSRLARNTSVGYGVCLLSKQQCLSSRNALWDIRNPNKSCHHTWKSVKWELLERYVRHQAAFAAMNGHLQTHNEEEDPNEYEGPLLLNVSSLYFLQISMPSCWA